MNQEHITNSVGVVVPNFPKMFFWEYNFDKIDWKSNYLTVIERVIERGSQEDWQELFRYYGYDMVLDTLKNGTIYLMDHSIDEVCAYFKLKPEELKCYRRKRSRPGHWF